MRIFAILALAFVAEARSPMPVPTLAGHRIIDGEAATIEEYPTQVSLRYSGSHTCGAVHLNAATQLTAAHCVDGRLQTGFDVYYGSASRTAGGVLASATGYFMHESYGAPDGDNAFPNDIAVVSSVVSFDGVTAVAANLPSGNSDFAGSVCTITGWGRTSSSNSLPDELQKVSNPIIDNTECDGFMASISGAGIADYHICIYDNFDQSSGSCNGDSGGPMHCMEDGVTVVAGVTSWGISSGGACATDYPAVYTRTSYFLDWIVNNS